MMPFLLLFTLLFSSPPAIAAQENPTALVKRVADQLLTILQRERARIERDPRLIYRLVEDQLVPHFDFEKITRAAVGRAWRQASPTQRRRLIEAFRQVLVRTYAQTLLKYSGQQIRYFPAKPGRRRGTVTVPTEVREAGGPPIPVDYRMYRKGNTWKVYDVVIDHVSLVANYRHSFQRQIHSKGIDGLITRLQAMNRGDSS